MDDLESAAMLALVQASRRWNSERGVPFTAYARRRIDGAIVDEIRRVRYGHTHGEADPQPVSTSDHESAGATTDKPAEDPQPLLDQMTPRQRLVVQLREEGYSTHEIAERLGVSSRAVRAVSWAGMWRAGIMPSRPHLITREDLYVLAMNAEGVPLLEQAARVGKTYEGVKKQRIRVMQKLGARSISDAVEKARALGLLDAGEGQQQLFG